MEGQLDRPQGQLDAKTPTHAHVQGQLDDKTPEHAHVIVHGLALERMLEVELPPESYYEALRASLGRKHPHACSHVLDHLVSVEALMHVAIVSGFSFGVSKCQVLHL